MVKDLGCQLCDEFAYRYRCVYRWTAQFIDRETHSVALQNICFVFILLQSAKMKKCFVNNCENNEENCENTFFPLPKNEVLAKQWLQFCNNPKLLKTRVAYICTDHFRREDLIGSSSRHGVYKINRTTPNAVPCLRNGPGTNGRHRNNKRLANDLFDPDAIAGVPVSKSARQDNKNIPKYEGEIIAQLDLDSSEAVIDELHNQIEFLRQENLRTTVNFQLTIKKCKQEVLDLKKQLNEAHEKILILEMEKADNIQYQQGI